MTTISLPRMLWRMLFLLVMASGSSRAVTTPLTWQPPAGWQNYTTFTIPASGWTVEEVNHPINPVRKIVLDNNTDYRILAPNKIVGRVNIQGGRNIVWIGGHIEINAGGGSPARHPLGDAPNRWGVRINDGAPNRIVFIEGLRIDGDDLAEGFGLACPNSHIYLQNIAIGTIRFRGFDDRDGTGSYDDGQPPNNHPDLISNFGGYKSLQVDGFSGRTQYQGFFLRVTAPPSVAGPTYFRRVNIEAVELPEENQTEEPFLAGLKHAGHNGLVWYGDNIEHIYVDNGTFWFKHHVNSGWGSTGGGLKKGAFRDSNGNVVAQPVSGSALFRHNLQAGGNASNGTTQTPAQYIVQIATDANGEYGFWSDSATGAVGSGRGFSNWDNTAAGRIYSGLIPGGGDWVPLTSAGIGYANTVGYGYNGNPGTGGGGGPPDSEPPSAPTNLAGSAIGPGQVNLSWTASTDNIGVTGYVIDRTGGAGPVTINTPTSAVTYSDTSVQPSTVYAYVVKARDQAGNISGASNSINVTTPADTTPPSQPTNLAGVAVSPTRIDLSWSPSTDNVAVATYQVLRNGGVLANAVAGTTYSDTSAQPGNSYSYAVKARDTSGNLGPASTTINVATPIAVLNPVADTYAESDAPSQTNGDRTQMRARGSPAWVAYSRFNLSSLSGQTVSSSVIRLYSLDPVTSTLSFKAVANNTWSESSTNWNNRPAVGSTIATAAGAANNDWLEVDLGSAAVAGQLFSFAIESSGQEARFRTREHSNQPQLVVYGSSQPPPPDTTPPTPPGNLTATAMSSSQINLGWTASTDNVAVTNYVVERDGNIVALPTGTSFSDTGLTPSTTYSYVVTAIDAAMNESAPSNTANATTPASSDTTPPTAPTNLVANVASSTQIDLTWNASTDNFGVTNYRVKRGGAVVAQPTSPNHSDTGLTPSTSYSYVVTAVDAAGNESAASNTANASTPSGGGGGPFNLNPVVDSHVRQERPSNNYGTNSNLRVNSDGSDVRITYLKFDLSSLAGQTLATARLRLMPKDTVSGTYSVKSSSATNWTEGAITWSNRPSLGSTVLGSIAGATAGAWVEFDLTASQLQSAVGGLLTLAIDTTNNDELSFESRETSTEPELILTTQ